MIYIAAYDIEDDAERQKVASILQAWGFVRVQRSLYVGRLPRGAAGDLAKVLARVLKGRGHVVLVPVSESQLEAAVEVGSPPYAPLRPPRYAPALIV